MKLFWASPCVKWLIEMLHIWLKRLSQNKLHFSSEWMHNETCIINAIIPRLKYIVMVICCQSILKWDYDTTKTCSAAHYAIIHQLLRLSLNFTRENMVGYSVLLWFQNFINTKLKEDKNKENYRKLLQNTLGNIPVPEKADGSFTFTLVLPCLYPVCFCLKQ